MLQHIGFAFIECLIKSFKYRHVVVELPFQIFILIYDGAQPRLHTSKVAN